MKTVVVDLIYNTKGLKVVSFTSVENDYGETFYFVLSKLGKYLDAPNPRLNEGEFYKAENTFVEDKYVFNFPRTTIIAAVFEAAQDSGFQFKEQLPGGPDQSLFLFQKSK